MNILMEMATSPKAEPNNEEALDLHTMDVDEVNFLYSEASSDKVLNFYLPDAQLIPQDFIDDLIQRVDITEVIGRRLEMKRVGNEYRAICPFHATKLSLTVVPQKSCYHCFSCAAHGNALAFLMDYENLSFIEAVEELAIIAGVEIPKLNKTEQQ